MHGQQEGVLMRRLISIDHKIDSMQDSLALLVRATAKGLRDELLDEFGKSERAIRTYLALDGERSVSELVALLGYTKPNVSRELGWLKRKRLVDATEIPGLGKRYAKKHFDGVVGLSEALGKKLEELRAKKLRVTAKAKSRK